ncbi:MAG: PqqD family protein [Clostridiaceae bacterium]|nr:PqqD family protein [Clostridiaceae bacterium]
MRAKKQYCHVTLAGKEYLLPYGQNIADLQWGIETNETGVLLWRELSRDRSSGELAALLAREYQLPDNRLPEIEQDVKAYIQQLENQGILEGENDSRTEYPEQYFQTGPLRIGLSGPDVLFERYFAAFACEAGQCHQKIRLLPFRPGIHQNGIVLVRNRDVILLDAGEKYIFLFPGFPVIYEMHLIKDGTEAVLYCNPLEMEERAEDIFHAIRFAFLVIAQKHGLYLLHSASVAYKGRAWLFSGPSGMGKSTHANLWKTCFGTELLNGDLNMIGREQETAVVYGQPWCGTSGICTNKRYLLGGIVFLKQAQENYFRETKEQERILDCIRRLISPSWTEEQLLSNVHFGEWIAQHTEIFHLCCTKEEAAAEFMKCAIDEII